MIRALLALLHLLPTPHHRAARALRVVPALAAASIRHRVEPCMAVGLCRAESGCNPNAVSPGGDHGALQVRAGGAAPASATTAEMLDPWRNADWGLAYLRRMHDKCGTWTGALSMYSGSGTCGPSRYARRVMAHVEICRAGVGL